MYQSTNYQAKFSMETRVVPTTRSLNKKFRLDHDKSSYSMKFGIQFAYTLPNDLGRGAHVNLLTLPF